MKCKMETYIQGIEFPFWLIIARGNHIVLLNIIEKDKKRKPIDSKDRHTLSNALSPTEWFINGFIREVNFEYSPWF